MRLSNQPHGTDGGGNDVGSFGLFKVLHFILPVSGPLWFFFSFPFFQEAALVTALVLSIGLLPGNSILDFDSH